MLKRAAEMNFLSRDANEILHLLAKHVSPIALIRALRRQASTRRLHSKVAMCLALCVNGKLLTFLREEGACDVVGVDLRIANVRNQVKTATAMTTIL